MTREVKTVKFGKVMGLGDTLWFTPMFKVFKNTSSYFHDDPRARSFSFLFDGLTEVNFDNSAGLNHLDFLHENYGALNDRDFRAWRELDATHIATKIFKTLGVEENKFTIIPQINVNDECMNLGLEILAQIGKVENPLILVSNTSAGTFQGDQANNWQAKYRTLNPRAMQEIVNKLSENYTVLHCGKQGEVFELDNVVKVYNLLAKYPNPYKVIAGLYKIVGKYVGLDTGDYNLMLSVGGESKVLIPSKAPWWNGVSSIFTEKEFQWERVRTEYINFREYNRVFEKNKLSF